MNMLITSIVGIQTIQKELEKYPTEQEKQEAMEMIYSKDITTSYHNILYFLVAIVSAGLIHWALK